MVTDVVISTAVFYIIHAFRHDNSYYCLIIMVTLIYVLNYVLVALTKVLAFQTDFRIITSIAYVDGDLTCIVKHESSAL